jgi:hypothetical protein
MTAFPIVRVLTFFYLSEVFLITPRTTEKTQRTTEYHTWISAVLCVFSVVLCVKFPKKRIISNKGYIF